MAKIKIKIRINSFPLKIQIKREIFPRVVSIIKMEKSKILI